LEEVRQGESFVITEAGKPIAKITGLSAGTATKPRRLGFMKGELAVPEDFDKMGRHRIEQLFGGSSRTEVRPGRAMRKGSPGS
jgi:antitoxin (DNA-binding transcriptional repressor) of toxin-antitoxin stability system